MLPLSDITQTVDTASHAPSSSPPTKGRLLQGLSPFWHDRLIESSLIVSLALYYVIGNEHLGTGRLFQVNTLFSLPFLLIFAALCWYRLSFAVALLPLALPYYLLQKTVISHYSFSLAEIAFGTCLGVALLQFLLQRGKWQYRLSWQELQDRLGLFAIPMLVFFLAAAFSVVIAYDHTVALRALREEVFDPLVYLLLAMFCLRSRQDLARLLAALFATGLVVALMGMAQYFLFKNQLVLEPDGIRRVHAVYGSANSIGLFFDYVLPIGLALALAAIEKAFGIFRFWWVRILAVAVCLPLLLVLYLSQSRGAEIAIAVAAVFIVVLSIRNRRVLLVAGVIFVIALGVFLVVFHRSIAAFIFADHTSSSGVSTATVRIYLWESALRMIHDHLWFGVGMDNWLCYYSSNSICSIPALVNHHYWILQDPVTHASTGLVNQRDLSHPHNIFLHVWVSMGIFGLLAFIAVLILFFWQFSSILRHLRSADFKGSSHLQWMTIGAGAAMLAALVQGMVDSSFLEQDLAFCFWMLVAALLLLRYLSGRPWRDHLHQKPSGTITEPITVSLPGKG